MITVSENAAEKIRKFKSDASENEEEKFLRVAVINGGCSGHQYKMDFDTIKDENDVKVDSNGVSIIIDKNSLPMISGLHLDYVEGLEGSSFVFNNPNATGGCGCGQSFSI